MAVEPRTKNGGVAAVGETGDGVDARQDLLDVVLVQFDGVPVAEEVVALPCRGCPVGVGAPDGTCIHQARCMELPFMDMDMFYAWRRISTIEVLHKTFSVHGSLPRKVCLPCARSDVFIYPPMQVPL